MVILVHDLYIFVELPSFGPSLKVVIIQNRAITELCYKKVFSPNFLSINSSARIKPLIVCKQQKPWAMLFKLMMLLVNISLKL